MTSEPSAEPASPVISRADEDHGFASRVVPLLSLAVLTAFVVQSCLTQPPSAPAVPPFDEAVAEHLANTAALAALGALPPHAEPNLVITALNLGAVNFATGSSDIPPTALPLLDAAARAVVAMPQGVRILIGGHTDSRGARDANLALSEQRAAAVRDALVQRGVPPAQLAIKGHGDSRPIATNATDEGRFRNRRIEFSLER
jgi:OOP family OmpA-OmpF porin